MATATKRPKRGAPKKAAAPQAGELSPDVPVSVMPIAKVKPYKSNPRRNDASIPKVIASLRQFGWRQPIVVDEKLVVLAGHTRLEAAKQMGLTRVPVHVAKGLTAAEARAYRLADNRSGEDSEWDFPLVALELQALEKLDFDLALTGFEAEELGRLRDLKPEVEFKEFDESAAAEVKMATCPECGHEFPR